jgi:hypothetical protein
MPVLERTVKPSNYGHRRAHKKPRNFRRLRRGFVAHRARDQSQRPQALPFTFLTRFPIGEASICTRDRPAGRRLAPRYHASHRKIQRAHDYAGAYGGRRSRRRIRLSHPLQQGVKTAQPRADRRIPSSPSPTRWIRAPHPKNPHPSGRVVRSRFVS